MTLKLSAPDSAGRSSLLGAVGSVAGITLISRGLGFVRWIVQASTVGAGVVAGAYATANQVPNVLYEVVVGGALAATVVPLLAAPLAAGKREEVEEIASGLLGLVLAVLVPLAIVLACLAGPIAALFPVSQGADPALQHQLVADFLRMFALQVPLYGLGVVLTGVLQAHGRFSWPTLTPIASSLVVMATYAVYALIAPAGAHASGAGASTANTAALSVLGWGTTAGVAALSLPLLWPVHRLGLRLRPHLHVARTPLARMLRLGGAGMVTLVAQQISVLAVLALARRGGEPGTVAVYQYTQAVYLLPYAVAAVPVATVLYPRTARALSSGRCDAQARWLVGASTALVCAVSLAGAGVLVAMSDGAERFFSLLTRVPGMAGALVAMAPGIVGFALIYQATRVLFAADRARTAALAAASGWVVVSLASAAAVHVMAPEGGAGGATLVALGLASSLGMMVAGLGLLAALASCVGWRGLAPVWRVLAVCGPVVVCASWAAHELTASLAGASTLTVVGASLVAAVVVAVLTIGAALLVQRDLISCLRGGSDEAGDPV